jgi:YfiH family protein
VRTREVLVDGRPLPLVESSVLPPEFSHGFTTREGGVSTGPFASLNLGLSWGDEREAVMENRRRLRAAGGAKSLYVVPQVHGAGVVTVRADDEPGEIALKKADALVSDVAGAALAVFVADCVPVLVADPRTGACAAVHAGWRGVVAGVAPSAITRIAEAFGGRAADLRVALGPSIGRCCFEVGPEVAAAFASAFPAARAGEIVVERPAARPHVDLRGALRAQLAAVGIAPGHIEASEACTRCDPARFFSFRRDNTRTGQHMAFITRRA